MKKKFAIFSLSIALILGMILLSVGQQPMLLPGFNLTDLIDVDAAAPVNGYVIIWDSATGKWIPAAAGGGAGNVTGPGSSTDNAIATFNLATGKIIQQNHSITISDTDILSGIVGLNLTDGTDTHPIKAIQETGLGGRLTFGLDETARTMVICDVGDIDTDLGLAVANNPVLCIFNSDVSSKSMLNSSQLRFFGTDNYWTGAGRAYFQMSSDISYGSAFAFESSANIELVDTNAEQAWMYLEPKINQTSTAGYIGLLMDVTETGTGSGTNALMDLRVATASKFMVNNSGEVSIGGVTPVSGTKLLLPQEDDATTPTLAFGDGDTGFYESADDTLSLSLGGTGHYIVSPSIFYSATSFGFRLYRLASASTVPAYAFNGDSDTGIGRAAADQLSLIAGGVEGIRLTEATGVLQTHQLTAGITADVGSAQGNGVLYSSYNEISTCANVGDAVTLPSASVGIKVTIINNGANAADVFPAADDDCGGGVNIAVSLAAGSNITYIAIDVTTWEVI